MVAHSLFMALVAAVVFGVTPALQLEGNRISSALREGGRGIYGVIAYPVSQRRREIGIRIALGAGRWRTVSLVVRQATVVTAAGTALGLGLGVVLVRALAAELEGFRVAGGHSGTYLIVVAVLLVSALAAALPARRAARVDPASALREP